MGFIGQESKGFSYVELRGWVAIFAITILCFFAGRGLIWGIDWVVAGFRQGAK